MTPNEQAFTKISEELHRLRNDLEVLKRLAIIAGNLSQWHRSKIELETSGLHSEKMGGATHILRLLHSEDGVTRETVRTEARILRLSKLEAQYFLGHDIVAAKLTQD